MPNWCSNRVEVYDTEENIKKFKEYVSDGDLLFSFHKIKPLPEELKDTRSPSGEPLQPFTYKSFICICGHGIWICTLDIF